MAISNYSEIKTAVEAWLDRSGFTELTNQTADFIAFAQRRIQREVRIPPMEAVTNLTVSSVSEEIPTDYLQSKTMMIIRDAGNKPLVRAPYEQVRKYTSVDCPQFFSQAGGNFYFGPPPDQEYTIELVYYKELEYVSATVATNWFSQFAPELILYAALAEAYDFLKDAEQAAYWNGKYETAKALLIRQQTMGEWSGSPMAARDESLMDSNYAP